MTQQFSLGAILSVTTGVLCCDFEDMQKLLSHMVGESLFTHATIRAANECRPYLYEQHPWLRKITQDMVLPDTHLTDKRERAADCFRKVALLAEQYGEQHTIYPIHGEDHEHLSAEEDLRRLGFKGRIITISDDDTPSPYGNITWENK